MIFIFRALPSQHRKKKKVDQVEKELLCHPLALYPHIEDSVPPDVRVKRFFIFSEYFIFYSLQKNTVCLKKKMD